MSVLTIHIRFIAHSYSGIRFRQDRQEELDWPPSPGRLHEALLCAALLGIPRSIQDRNELFTAFRWFEKLPAPEIWASAQDESLRTRPRIAIPQNNPRKVHLHINPSLLAPTKKAVSVTGDALEVRYHWQTGTEAPASSYLDVLSDAAARISYLGRAEDRVEVSFSVVEEPMPLPLVRWQPNPDGEAQLWVAKAGTTDGLETRHKAIVPPRESKKPAQRWMRSVSYSDDGPQAMRPVATAIFQLFPDNDDPDATAFSCDPEFAGRWREFLRHLIVKLASEQDNWDDPLLAAELLTGHSGPGKPASRPHLAIVPLPTINASRTADGRVRRVALLGYASSDVATQAQTIYETLFKALDNFISTDDTPFRRHGKDSAVRLLYSRPAADPIWHQLTVKSRIWYSIIPVAISRGFKVPKMHPDGHPLNENERHQRKLSEWATLLRDSLKHIGLPPEITAACLIECTPTPLIPKSQRAEKYRAPGEKAVLTHVRLEFPCQVRGPIILGDRRYMGLGLFVPSNK
jgi:CRISPR-associated protein Csb2